MSFGFGREGAILFPEVEVNYDVRSSATATSTVLTGTADVPAEVDPGVPRYGENDSYFRPTRTLTARLARRAFLRKVGGLEDSGNVRQCIPAVYQYYVRVVLVPPLQITFSLIAPSVYSRLCYAI